MRDAGRVREGVAWPGRVGSSLRPPMGVSSRTLSRWYLQLAASLDAGLPLARSIGAAHGPPAALRTELQARLIAGDGVDEALERGGTWLPSLDRQLIAAGARAGRLPEVVRRLGERHQETSRAAMTALAAALYPLGVAHFGVVALPLPAFFNGEGAGVYFTQVGQVLVPLWAFTALIGMGIRQRWTIVGMILNLLPLVGGSRRLRSIADLAFVLEVQLVAGIRLDVAWLQAALAAGDRRLEPVAVAAAEAVQRGEPIGPVLAGRRELPAPFADFYANGEQTGKLDESLRYVQAEFQRRSVIRLRAATVAYPALLFVGVGAWAIFQIFSVWLNHFRSLELMQ